MEARNIVVTAVGGALVLLSIMGFLHSLKPCQLLTSLRSSVRSAREKIAAFHEGSTDQVGLLVQAKMQQLKVENVRWCFWAFSASAIPLTSFTLYNIVMGKTRSYTVVQDALHLFLHGICTLVAICPGMLTWKTIDVYLGAFVLTVAVHTSPWAGTATSWMIMTSSSTAVLAILNLMRRSVPVSAFLNSIMAIAVVGNIMTHEQMNMREGIIMNITQHWVLVALELLLLALFPTIAYMLDVSVGMGIRSSLQVEVTKEVLSAAVALLRTCCDVVVELDQTGGIMREAHDLGGFLLRGPRQCFMGTKLSDLFLLEEDKQKFSSKLCSGEPSNVGLADAMHVGMKDGNDEQVRIELMTFGFRHLDGTRHYMVGLREFSDLTRGGKKRSRRRQRGAEGDSPQSSASNSQQEERSTSGSRAASVDTTSLEIQVASITADATQSGLPIKSYSPGFRQRIGRLQLDSRFTDIVQSGFHFQQWVQNALNVCSRGGEVSDYQVTLIMRHGRMEATCRLMMEEDSDPDLTNIELVFFNIRKCRGRSRGRQEGALRGTPVAHMSL